MINNSNVKQKCERKSVNISIDFNLTVRNAYAI